MANELTPSEKIRKALQEVLALGTPAEMQEALKELGVSIPRTRVSRNGTCEKYSQVVDCEVRMAVIRVEKNILLFGEGSNLAIDAQETLDKAIAEKAEQIAFEERNPELTGPIASRNPATPKKRVRKPKDNNIT